MLGDVLSDATIVVAPIRLVYRVLLSRTQKIRLTAIFSMTIVTTIVSMNHAAFVITVGGLREILAAIVQVKYHSRDFCVMISHLQTPLGIR